MRGAQAARPELVLVRRVITRAKDAGGEEFEDVSLAEFEDRARRGDFAFWWRAHGLHYGIPVSAIADVEAGRCVLFNGSRNALPRIREAFPSIGVIEISAPRERLRQRLTRRARETAGEIEARLSGTDMEAPPGAIKIVNDASIAEGVTALLDAVEYLCRADGSANK